MKLRTAIKIMRHVEEPWRYKTEPRYKRGQIQRAWRRVERQDNKRNWDRRLPYLPTEEELEMRGEIHTTSTRWADVWRRHPRRSCS